MYSIKSYKNLKINELILYRDFKFEDTVRAFCALDKNSSNIGEAISGLLEIAGEYGL